jgi:MbtH protein
MSDPFERDDREYRVLVNIEGRHSLWPAHLVVPEGWDVAYGPALRADCLAFVEDNWTDMRPRTPMT